MRFKDRFATWFLVASLAIPCLSLASGMDSLDVPPANSGVPTFKPYRRIHLGPAYENTVIEAMAYECPYCRELNTAMFQWARTLPKTIHFVQMPAVVGLSWVPQGQAYFAVMASDPSAIRRFDEAAFAEVQDRHLPFSSPKTYLQAAKDAGLNLRSYYDAAMDPQVHQLVLKDIKVMAKVHVRKTPTLIICGRYAINPGGVQGNYGVFFELADALVSRCLTENRLGGGTQ
ncbi:disulfide bond formation protein DsbA [Acidithiobacillus caldus]|uniref:Disulfide bond formation protein DsbA n=1 Tax=Acidithiobacillus caldus TaxID=33059 RepID=A0A1E7Z078_9PROT|nr:disulfide bond formation protein DsbA [Acidithiobacillus caldus]